MDTAVPLSQTIVPLAWGVSVASVAPRV